MPMSHREHCVAPAAEYEPAAQSPQATVVPMLGLAVPAEQSALVVLSAQKEPAGQGAHDRVAPAPVLTAPAGQSPALAVVRSAPVTVSVPEQAAPGAALGSVEASDTVSVAVVPSTLATSTMLPASPVSRVMMVVALV